MTKGEACLFCGAIVLVKQYAVTVDGVAMNLAPMLCQDHGERFLLRVGMVMATLDRPAERVFRNG